MNPKEHWEQVYREKDPVSDVSWYEAKPATSLHLIAAAGVFKHQSIIDVGGGASVLVDHLLELGFFDVTVLDIARGALDCARRRLGPRAQSVNWIEADVTTFVPPKQYTLWHDRAVFHFLTDPGARQAYRRTLLGALAPGGHLIMATFAKDGPPKCSGLPVARYDAPTLGAELGTEFHLVAHFSESHHTPWGVEQRFAWFRFQRGPDSENRLQAPDAAPA